LLKNNFLFIKKHYFKKKQATIKKSLVFVIFYTIYVKKIYKKYIFTLEIFGNCIKSTIFLIANVQEVQFFNFKP